MKFISDRPLDDPNVAARKLIEIANGIEAVQDGRIFVRGVDFNELFLGAVPCG